MEPDAFTAIKLVEVKLKEAGCLTMQSFSKKHKKTFYELLLCLPASGLHSYSLHEYNLNHSLHF